jgi:glycosyltransferase involved in cell wall biosynthesis
VAGNGATAARSRVLSRRVLHVRSSRGLAGPERHLLELIPALVAHGFESEVALLYRPQAGDPEDHPLLAPLRELAVPVFQVGDPDRLGRPAARAIAERLERGDLAALHGHDPKSDWVISRAAKRGGVLRPTRCFATLHLYTRASLALRFHRRFDLRLLRGFDGAIAVAPALAGELSRSARRGRWRVIANGLDATQLRARAAAALPAVRAELREPGEGAGQTAAGEAGHGPVLLAAGRLARQKGFDLLLEALPAVVARQPSLRVLIAGDGPERGALVRQAARLGLGARLRFLGERRDLAALLATADAFVLPSRSEGSPYVLLEAMALGTPIVAAAVGDVGERLEGGAAGELVAAADPAALGAGILRCLARPEEARGRAARAREIVAGPGSASRMAGETAAFYSEILAIESDGRAPTRSGAMVSTRSGPCAS